ncbi:MAG: hypothetical protein IPM51_05335 [Sphingobacteriaceae bacterium]|nr:hypothetical protein [Sphingobacteriaceae bacterium]
MRFVRIASIIALLCPGSQFIAQVFDLHIHSVNGNELDNLKYTRKFNSKELAIAEVKQVLNKIRENGFLLTETDSIIEKGSKITAYIKQGDQYKTGKIALGNLNPGLASKIGFFEKSQIEKPFKYKSIVKYINKIISHYENNGFPFVSVTLDSVNISQNHINAKWLVIPGKSYKIDSIQVIGNSSVSKKFLLKYLGLKEGMLYNESGIISISQKCKQLPFILEKQAPQTRLTEKNAKLRLFLDKKSASQFDGIVGLLPDANTKKTVITGDVKLKIINGVFKSGETFDLEWRRLQSQTQDFKGKIIYPYMLGTPFGADYYLKIYRRDTTFIDIHNNIGIQYYFKGLNNFKVFYKQRSSDLISTNGLSFITTLPEYADIRTNSYGFGVLIEKVDYRFNPRKGITLNLTSQAGTRNIRRNPKINPLVYENTQLKSDQYQGEIEFNAYIPLKGVNIIHFGMQGAGIYATSSLFRNELFRIGGFKTLRGFDEESIFTSAYVIPTIEYRLLFSQNSSLLLFIEGAWYENNSTATYLTDTPVSAGAGINFDTKAGILSLHYAVGNQFGNGFDIRSGKIHVGLTALF